MKYPVPCSIQMRTATNISFLYRLNDGSVFSFHVLCIKLPKHKETHWVGLLGQNQKSSQVTVEPMPYWILWGQF